VWCSEGSSPNSTDFFKITLINLIIGLLKKSVELGPDPMNALRYKCYLTYISLWYVISEMARNLPNTNRGYLAWADYIVALAVPEDP
jgi:hypothetical protein